MSLTVALNTAVSGLLANQEAIAATSENIANVNTENFSRREATFFTDAIPGQFAGVGVEIERAGVDQFLLSAGFSSASDASSTQLIADALSRIEASLGAPGENISFANELDAAFAAFTQASAAPSSTAARAVAINALDNAFAAFNRTLDAIDAETLAAADQLDTQTARANTLLEELFNLNQIVSQSDGAADQINARLSELSSLIDINVTRNDDGVVSVSTGNGSFLVNGGGFTTLAADTIGGVVNGGSLGGLVALINTDLPALRGLVSDTASAIAAEINEVYSGNAQAGTTGPGALPLIVANNGLFGVNEAIVADPDQLAIARPEAGGVGGINDGSGAAAIAALATGNAAGDVASAVAQLGAASQAASSAAASASTFAAEIDGRISSQSGVNLDEELANLIQLQRSFGANARVITAVDELYQTLLGIL